ncbi:MAG: putative CocE/NonD family hydrolase, partial [Flavobacterium sp.]
KNKAEKEAWYMDQFIRPTSKDGSIFFNELGTVKEATDKYYKDNFFMQEIVDHPSYDSFWQTRNLLPHLNGINHAVMTVGGWFDAEDLAGPLNIYKTIEKNNPKAKNTIVMGPFSHGGWGRESGKHFHNDIYFGDSIATFYQKNIEYKFFTHYLKGNSKKAVALPEAYMFDTGKKEWNEFTNWPPKESTKLNFYLNSNGKLEKEKSKSNSFSEYYSDPNNPVPSSINYEEYNGFTPRNYMSEDQRFALNRPDVVTFTTEDITEDITLAGEIMAKLKIASSSSDADFIVKLIDIYPADEPQNEDKPNVLYANYHQMVRSEVMPARFRSSFEKPEALTQNQTTDVNFKLQDVLHTFKKGHKIQIQIQSTWYPMIAVNPQKFLENQYLAKKEDYTKSFIKVFNDSHIEVEVLK